MFEQDYIMRQIKEMIAVIMKAVFGEALDSADVLEQYGAESKDAVEPLCRLIERGEIAEAERLLFESMTMKTEANLLKGFSFYQYLLQKDDGFLEANGYSHEQAVQGIRRLAALFGAAHLADLFLPE